MLDINEDFPDRYCTIDKCIADVYTFIIMQTAAIYIRTELETKRKAQKVAKEIGISLSGLVNTYLKQVIRTKKVEFSAEEPSEYLIKAIKKARENRKKGRGSPIFDNAEDAIAYLHKMGV